MTAYFKSIVSTIPVSIFLRRPNWRLKNYCYLTVNDLKTEQDFTVEVRKINTLQCAVNQFITRSDFVHKIIKLK